MYRPLPAVLFALLSSALLPCQQGDANARKSGTIFKHEVDGLIDVLRDTSRRDQASPAAHAVLGSDALGTAKILVAMGHCHRRYHIGDGPVVKPSIDYLLQQRRADGSFGDVATTAWTIDAFLRMDDKAYGEEVAAARRWIAQQGGDAPSFAGSVTAMLERVQADRFPQHFGAEAAARAHELVAAGASIDRGAAADTLLQLVVCQAANLALDKTQAGDGAPAAWSPTQERAWSWLWEQQEGGVISMMGQPSEALTGFALLALQTKPRAQRTAEQQATIVKGLRWLAGQQKEDGSFGDSEVNYVTCVAVGALSRWQDPSVAPVLQKAQRVILGFQNIEQAGYGRGDRDYGSVGYGGSQRGDLSNTHFALETLRATGLPEDHEAMKKAIVFLQRTQNLKSVNDLTTKIADPSQPDAVVEATSGDDGGAAYYPGNSAAGYIVRPDGKVVPRSYGSMTYALLKAYTLAGVKGDDPRVQAAVDWIRNHWTLAANPGADPALGKEAQFQGLFYYYMLLAQALDAAGIDTIEAVETTTSKSGGPNQTVRKVDWRKALRNHLANTQNDDGSWVNAENGRWMESLPLLCTCYAMVALERCQ